MNLDKFTGSGSTPSRRRFWDKVQKVVMASQKTQGRNASVDEQPGFGTVINFPDQTPSALSCPTVDSITVVIADVVIDCSCEQLTCGIGVCFGDIMGDVNGTYTLSPTTPGDDGCPLWVADGPSVTLHAYSDEGTCVVPICSTTASTQVFFHCCNSDAGGFWEVYVQVSDPCLQDPGVLVFDGDTFNLLSGGPWPHPGVASNYFTACAFQQYGHGGTATVSGWT